MIKKSTVSPKGFKLSRKKNSHCDAGDRILGSSFIVHIYERKTELISSQNNCQKNVDL